MVKPAQFSKIAMAALVGSVVVFSHTQPADAAWFRKDDFLGQLTTTDNAAYWRAQGQWYGNFQPPNRNQLCQWRYGNNNVWGQGVGWGQNFYKTNCYRWRWFWQ
ncbi:MAG TPA: hypothetical protein DD001_03825 [Microcoleaceae bacterium UBA10368]|jgi:hypothetical protein|uniref:Uncharacterized protein n=1 Tax=Microcoleus anatoxicus PTRS2 TaxID=2705321 RepID=A0ABU8YVA8_9CYAN|nr:hypothetical protein [Microcoleaceae cyanobacterium UBA10368]HCV31777.1 hypothetical protein [Microcoleaceae cyanobacterium UBA9251]